MDKSRDGMLADCLVDETDVKWVETVEILLEPRLDIDTEAR